MSYQQKLAKLQNLMLQKPDMMLSLYLNTDRRDQEQQEGKWKIALKAGFKRLDEYLKVSSEEELKRLHLIRQKVEDCIENLGRKQPRGIVIFASEDSGVWETFELQVPVETRFYWEERPVLDHLNELHKQYPLTALVLIQQNQVRILKTNFAQLEGSETMEVDLVFDDWRKNEGPSHVNSSMGSSAVKRVNQVDHFEDRVKENQYRWLKSLASKLDKKIADEKFEQVILVGDKEEGKMLDKNMNKQVDTIIEKNMFNENEHKVVEKLLDVIK